MQWRIQDFPQGGAPTPKIAIIFQIFAENCMKMKEFGSPGGRASLAPPLRSANGMLHMHKTGIKCIRSAETVVAIYQVTAPIRGPDVLCRNILLIDYI